MEAAVMFFQSPNFSFSDLFRALSGPSREKQQKDNQESSEPMRGESWSFQQLRDALFDCFRSNRSIRYSPASIDLSPLNVGLEGMKNLSRDGFEYGRFGYLDVMRRKVVMGRVSRGSGTMAVVQSLPPRGYDSATLVPIMLQHTHPASVLQNGDALHHLSDVDFITLLTTPRIQMSMVIAPDLTLICVKTGSTPTDMSEASIRRIVQSTFAEKLGMFPNARSLKRATGMICLEFGMSLYMITPESNGIAKRVRIINGDS